MTKKHHHLIVLGLCAILPALLVLLMPYSEGYQATRVPLSWFLAENWKSEDWQHCWLVLPIALLIVYLKRAELLASEMAGSLVGLPVLILAFLLFWVGYKVENIAVGYASIQILLLGIILWVGGLPLLRILFFPWAFLVFMWPLGFLDSIIAFPLRMLMSNAAVGLLQMLGIDVVRNGTGILSAPDTLLGLPAGKKFAVDVADPCSGIRSLFALMMVSALYAHFTLKVTWQKWVLFLCSAPLAIMGNLARIVMLTIGTIAFGAEFAIGKNALTDPSWFHMGAGYLVFIVALGGMVGIGTILQGISRFNLARLAATFDREKPEAAEIGPSPEDAPGAPDKPGPSRHEDIY